MGATYAILSFLLTTLKKVKETGEFPGGLVVRISGFHGHGPGSVPGQGTEILQAARRGQKTPKKPQQKKTGLKKKEKK